MSDNLAKLTVLGEASGTDFQAREMVSRSKPDAGPPSAAGPSYIIEATAIYEDANREVKRLLDRAKRAVRKEDTAEGKRFWLLASYESMSSRHVADMTDYSPAQVRRFRREAGRHEETGMPLGRVA